VRRMRWSTNFFRLELVFFSWCSLFASIGCPSRPNLSFAPRFFVHCPKRAGSLKEGGRAPYLLPFRCLDRHRSIR